MSLYEIVITIAFEHEFTEEEVDEGTELSHEFIKEKVNEMLDTKDYSIDEHELE